MQGVVVGGLGVGRGTWSAQGVEHQRQSQVTSGCSLMEWGKQCEMISSHMIAQPPNKSPVMNLKITCHEPQNAMVLSLGNHGKGTSDEWNSHDLFWLNFTWYFTVLGVNFSLTPSETGTWFSSVWVTPEPPTPSGTPTHPQMPKPPAPSLGLAHCWALSGCPWITLALSLVLACSLALVV